MLFLPISYTKSSYNYFYNMSLNIFQITKYRSLNLKKDTDRQQQILEQLARVRSELKDRRAQIERCVSNQNLANNNQCINN